ncbi:ketopantoate reductase family protein [Lentzea albida]|uniref:Ketopantoate reductase n=1 Tax=Lentzea albida TaxID=65499 RepID=A0A1H9K1G8_9PSEU|nr:2-dehydropantoate 2-reductase N-terminal domain-containing protein [Lentzea albida]SEQ93056.1 ketopantoate reductase [Lentzea albida]
MRILIFGRGAIATFYGWAFAEAGHQVEFYVRPGRAAQLPPEVDLRIRDGRARGAEVDERWPVTLREDLDGEYDLIVLSVNHDQLDGAVEVLAPHVGDATVLVFGNVWADPAAVVSPLPADQVVWGFPGAGGGFIGSELHGALLKNVFLGFCDDSNRGVRYRVVRDLFQRTGFSVSRVRDFRDWLWFHFIVDAAFLAPVLAAGGRAGFARSAGATREPFLLIREMIPLLKARGGTPRLGATVASRVPVGLLGFVLRQALSRENIFSHVLEQTERTGYMTREPAGVYARDVLAEARRLGVALPRLAALEPVFELV